MNSFPGKRSRNSAEFGVNGFWQRPTHQPMEEVDGEIRDETRADVVVEDRVHVIRQLSQWLNVWLLHVPYYFFMVCF